MRLLVSVVSAAEARAALAGGADIVDVKDPGEGALGAPAPDVLAEVVAAVGGRAPVSAALGDLPDLPHTAALAARGAVACGVDYVKVGLRGVCEVDRAVAVMSAVSAEAGPRVGVIAAAYADAARLEPPALAPAALPAVVRRCGLAGGLVDTLVKDGSGLWAWQSEADLRSLVAEIGACGATFGIAGQLAPGELRRAAAVLGGMPDGIVGVRSAVCTGGDRGGTLEAELVTAAAAELADARGGVAAGRLRAL